MRSGAAPIIDLDAERDAQLILGHSRLAVTQEIYTHEDREAQHEALTKISRALRIES